LTWLGTPYAPLFAHFTWVMGLYALLTAVRLDAVRARRATLRDFVRADGDTPLGARVARNLANQFELPMFAWIAVAIGAPRDLFGPIDLAVLWILVAGRVAHSAVQILTTDVALRGLVYTVTALAVLWIVARVALGVLPQ
jgi:hypothetical protein